MKYLNYGLFVQIKIKFHTFNHALKNKYGKNQHLNFMFISILTEHLHK
jgi:hypothetical protein